MELTGQERALYEALLTLDEGLARMYLGSCFVRDQLQNPDRHALRAHGLRELMEKLPKYRDVPVVSKSPSLKDKVRQLASSWKPEFAATDSTNVKNLSRFLVGSKDFFEWFSTEHLTRREQAATILRQLDPLSRRLPDAIEGLRIKEWQACEGFFQGVSHHTLRCTDDEFEAFQDTLERFLLDRLRPRTFEDQAELDAIIEEGERYAQT
jgi:hypothetical protein